MRRFSVVLLLVVSLTASVPSKAGDGTFRTLGVCALSLVLGFTGFYRTHGKLEQFKHNLRTAVTITQLEPTFPIDLRPQARKLAQDLRTFPSLYLEGAMLAAALGGLGFARFSRPKKEISLTEEERVDLFLEITQAVLNDGVLVGLNENNLVLIVCELSDENLYRLVIHKKMPSSLRSRIFENWYKRLEDTASRFWISKALLVCMENREWGTDGVSERLAPYRTRVELSSPQGGQLFFYEAKQPLAQGEWSGYGHAWNDVAGLGVVTASIDVSRDSVRALIEAQKGVRFLGGVQHRPGAHGRLFGELLGPGIEEAYFDVVFGN